MVCFLLISVLQCVVEQSCKHFFQFRFPLITIITKITLTKIIYFFSRPTRYLSVFPLRDITMRNWYHWCCFTLLLPFPLTSHTCKTGFEPVPPQHFNVQLFGINELIFKVFPFPNIDNCMYSGLLFCPLLLL